MAANSITTSLIVRLVDKATRPAKKVATGILGIEKASRKAGAVDFGSRLEKSISRNDRALDRARGGMVDAAAGFFALKAAIAAPVRAAMSFESAMADVKKVVDDFEDPVLFKQFQADLKRLSKDIPLAISDLGEIAAAAGEAGFAGDELLKVTEAAAKIGVAFGVSASEAGDALPQLMNSMGMTLDEVILLADGMNHLSNNMAASAPKVLEFTKRVGADAVSAFGFAAEEAAAFGAAMIAAGRAPDVASTSFLNMGRALTKGSSATKRQRAAFRKLGLDARIVAKDMQKDAVGTTLKVIEALKAMPEAQRAALQSDIFGNEARALTALIGNTDALRDALGLVADESKYAGSAFKEFEVRAKTFGAKTQKFDNLLTGLKITIGSALIPALSQLIETIAPAIEGITAFAEAHPELTSNVIAATAGIVGFKLALSGLKFVGLLGRGGALSLLSMGFNTVGRAAIGARTAATESIRLQTALAGFSGKRLTALSKVRAALSGLALAIPGVAPLAGVLTSVGAAVAGITAPVWVGIAGAVTLVAAAGYTLWKYWDRITSVVKGVAIGLREGLAPAFQALQPVLAPVAKAFFPVLRAFDALKAAVDAFLPSIKSGLNSFKEWISGFFQREILSDADKASLQNRTAQYVAGIVRPFAEVPAKLMAKGREVIDGLLSGMRVKAAELIEWVRAIPSKIIAAFGNIDLTGLIKWPQPPEWWNSLKSGAASVFGYDDGPEAAPVVENAQARGGRTRVGKRTLVGEEGPELVEFGGSGWVSTARQTRDILNELGGSVGLGSVMPAPAPVMAPSFSISAPVTIHGAQNAEDIAKQIGDALREELEGLHIKGMF